MLVRYHRLVQQESKRKIKKVSSDVTAPSVPPEINVDQRSSPAPTAARVIVSSHATVARNAVPSTAPDAAAAAAVAVGTNPTMSSHSAHVTSRRPLRVVSSNDDVARKDAAVVATSAAPKPKPSQTIVQPGATSMRSGPMRVAAPPARVAKKRSQSPIKSREDAADAGGDEDANCAQQ